MTHHSAATIGMIVLTCIIAGTAAAADSSANERLFEAIRSGSTTGVSSSGVSAHELNEARDSLGRSPLLVARLSNQLEVFEWLLIVGADPNALAAPDGGTVLDSLTSPDSYDYLELFLRFGGDINTPVRRFRPEGESYLVAVARFGRTHLCYAAIQAGARTDVLDSEGRTLLGAAVASYSYQVAYNLLRWGAIQPERDLVPDVYEEDPEAAPGGPLMVYSPYWRAKFLEELQRRKADYRLSLDGGHRPPDSPADSP